jgi:hypothetical protein
MKSHTGYGLRILVIYYSVMHGEVIEDYQIDRPFPSCLIMGKNFFGQAIHSMGLKSVQPMGSFVPSYDAKSSPIIRPVG